MALQKDDLRFEDLRADSTDAPTLVCANFDGASVMLGKKSGVIAHILNRVPEVIPIHCVAHKLELAILDSVKNIPFLKKYDSTLRGLFIMYRASPKRLRELRSVAESLETSVISFTDLKKTRWVSSKCRAVKALENNMSAVVTHLEAMSAKGDPPEARGYLDILTSLDFLRTMHIMLDFIPLVTSVSQV
ncbi:hypothetical protein FSP39_020416 [Pinctada imbricata]|uniref:Zinc finger protein 862-like n=1 Tax=Pinctada imbricata TaxID=66713 RepID=A0AA88Y5L5_PINIB|nr:hypothetical protein FSP39_020416 [Pinctada imbricata]